MSVKWIARGFDMSVCGMSDWVNGSVSCAYPLVVVQEPVELQAPVSSLSRFDEECVRSERTRSLCSIEVVFGGTSTVETLELVPRLRFPFGI